MNESGMTKESMYDHIAEIRNLNQVEGFDPRQYMRLLQSDGQSAKYYLDVVYRKLWFRLKYPTGKIVKKLMRLTENVAIVEAKVYLDRNDPEDCYISNALAQRTTDDQFGSKYVELAETAAVGRALADAGFGLQFADLEGETDPAIVDAGLEHMGAFPDMGELPEGTYLEEELTGDVGHDAQEYHNMPGAQSPVMITSGQAAMQNIPPAMQAAPVSATQRQEASAEQNQVPVGSQSNCGVNSVQMNLNQIDKGLPVEQIYGMLNRDIAAAVVISTGYHKGKTLGQLAIEKPGSLSWYMNEYKGSDNLLRAAASFLVNTAMAA